MQRTKFSGGGNSRRRRRVGGAACSTADDSNRRDATADLARDAERKSGVMTAVSDVRWRSGSGAPTNNGRPLARLRLRWGLVRCCPTAESWSSEKINCQLDAIVYAVISVYRCTVLRAWWRNRFSPGHLSSIPLFTIAENDTSCRTELNIHLSDLQSLFIASDTVLCSFARF